MQKPKTHLYLYCFLLFSIIGYSQIPFIEKAQIDKAFILFNTGKPEEAYSKAHFLLKSTRSNYIKVNSSLLLAYYFKNQSLIDSSLYYCKKALVYNTSATDSLKNRLSALTYNLYALNNKEKGLLEESKKWHLLGLEVTKKKENLYYTHLHGLANTYRSLGRYSKALELFKVCINEAKEEEIIFGSYINLGIIYAALGQKSKSNSYLLKAKKLALKNNSTKALVTILLNLANNLDFGDPEKVNYLYEAKDICIANKFHQLELVVIQNIGIVFLNSNLYNEASVYFIDSSIKASNLGLLSSEMESYRLLEKTFKESDNYKNALHFNKKYHRLQDSISNLQKRKEIQVLEAKYNSLEKERAIKLLQIENSNKKLRIKTKEDALQNIGLQREIENKRSENTILGLQNGAEIRKNEIVLLKKNGELKAIDIDRQKTIRNIILVAFFILLIPIIGFAVLYYQKLQAQSSLHLQEQEIAKQEIHALIQEQELKLIKASVAGQDAERSRIAQEMHDGIGGNLAAIKLQFSQLEADPKNKQLLYKQLDDTYEQVRDFSHNLIPKKIRETDFIPLIKEYLKNVSNASNIEINVTSYKELVVNRLTKEVQTELFSILQELITNTLKHANATVIEVQVDVLNELVFFSYEDNGVGFSTDKKSGGIGLENIKNRVLKLKGVSHIDSFPKRGTLVTIEIPN